MKRRKNNGIGSIIAVLIGAGLFVIILCPWKLLLTVAAVALILLGLYNLFTC